MKDQRFLFQNELYADVNVSIKLGTQQEPASVENDTPCPSRWLRELTKIIAQAIAIARRAQSGASGSADDQSDSYYESGAGSERYGSESFALKTFPGHMAILCQSEYFGAQDHFIAGDHKEGGPQPTLSLTVQDASQLVVVEAIIAVLYGVTDSISKLQQHQLVHAVQYADLLQLDSVAQQATQLLLDAAKTDAGLSEDTLHALCKLVWPSCLLPLLPLVATRVKHGTESSTRNKTLQEVLLSVLGNLETVWTDTALSSALLALPLPAMELLLSADGLQVYSEDTVLYTAGRYLAQTWIQSKRAAAVTEMLAPLIRMQHLSDFQLMAQAINTDNSGFNILKQYKTLLGYLWSLRALQEDHTQLLLDVPDAPASMNQPPRQLLQPPPEGLHVNLAWRVSAKELLSAYVKCCASRTDQYLYSPHFTPPLHGLDWRLYLQWRWHNEPERAILGAHVVLNRAPQGAYVSWSMQITCSQAGIELNHTTRPRRTGAFPCPRPRDRIDVLELCAATDELDEAVWVSMGLPVDGDIEFVASVSM